jgi:hypothetical protein
MHVAATNVFQIVYSVYLGIAEAARDLAIQRTRERERGNTDVCYLVGEMENELAASLTPPW